jgi:hypothetical protein
MRIGGRCLPPKNEVFQTVNPGIGAFPACENVKKKLKT